MPVTIDEKFDSRESTVGVDSPSVDLLYVVQGTEDDSVVRTTVEANIPAMYAHCTEIDPTRPVHYEEDRDADVVDRCIPGSGRCGQRPACGLERYAGDRRQQMLGY